MELANQEIKRMVEFGKSADRIMAGYFCRLAGVSDSLYPFLLLNLASEQISIKNNEKKSHRGSAGSDNKNLKLF